MNHTTRRSLLIGALVTAFVASNVVANWLTSEYGFVPVGLGLTVTAGTYAAGAALVIRDLLHEVKGLPLVLVAIGIGAVVSWWVAEPAIAVASAVAFTFSELVDAAVYTPLRERRWRTAVVASSVAGAIVDTFLFLWIAFGLAAVTWSAMAGQLLGKVIWVAVPVALLGGYVRSRREVQAA